MDSLVQKAWELYRLTARFRIETIVKATNWLEEKYRQAPDGRIAMVVALHYLLLALRDDCTMISESAQEYCSRAARWQEEARHRMADCPLATHSTTASGKAPKRF